VPKNGGLLIFGTYGGSNKNWEAILPNLLWDGNPDVGLYGGGYYHTYRVNSAPGRPWQVVGFNSPTPNAPWPWSPPPPPLQPNSIPKNWFLFGSGFPADISPAPVAPMSPIVGACQSTYGGGDLEVVVRSGAKLLHFWRESAGNFKWHGPLELRTAADQQLSGYGADGNPAVIQGGWGSATNKNLEVLVPDTISGFWHLVGQQVSTDPKKLSWSVHTKVGESLGKVDAVAVVNSSFGGGLNLDVVVRKGQLLFHYFQDQNAVWTGSTVPFLSGAAGVPGFIQSTHGAAQQNFELVMPLANPGSGNGLQAFHRDNDNPIFPWAPGATFGSLASDPTDPFIGVGLIQSDFKTPNPSGQGCLEVLAVTAKYNFRVFTRANDTFTWSELTSPSAKPYKETVSSTTNQQKGVWRTVGEPTTVGIHAAVLKNPNTLGDSSGKALIFGYKHDQDGAPFGDVVGQSAVVTFQSPYSLTETVKPLSGIGWNPFCGGHAFLPDGSLLVTGAHGNSPANKQLHKYVPDGSFEGWHQATKDGSPVMLVTGRWYPTLTTLPDGRVLIMNGSIDPGSLVTPAGECAVAPLYRLADKAQIFNPVDTTLTAEIGGQLSDFFKSSAAFPWELYPFVFVLPNGNLFVHANNASRIITNVNTGALAPAQYQTPGLGHPDYQFAGVGHHQYPAPGSAALLPLVPPAYAAKIMIAGGSGPLCDGPGTTPSGSTMAEKASKAPADNNYYLLDLSAGSPAWQQHELPTRPGDQFAQGRVYTQLVLLPDKTALLLNGTDTGFNDAALTPVFDVDLYDPATNSWTALAPKRVPRMYHGTAILLPDARVMTAGTDFIYNPLPFHQPQYRVEVFTPPYLLKAGGRPTITGISPTPLEYSPGASVTVNLTLPGGRSLAYFTLVRPGAVTHSFDMDQRVVQLTHTGSGSAYTATLSPSNNHLPPGMYMLFAIDSQGVPSEGKFIRIKKV